MLQLALKYSNEALKFDPNNVKALVGSSEAEQFALSSLSNLMLKEFAFTACKFSTDLDPGDADLHSPSSFLPHRRGNSRLLHFGKHEHW